MMCIKIPKTDTPQVILLTRHILIISLQQTSCETFKSVVLLLNGGWCEPL